MRINLRKMEKSLKALAEAIKWAKDAVKLLEEGERVDALDSLDLATSKVRESLSIMMGGRS